MYPPLDLTTIPVLDRLGRFPTRMGRHLLAGPLAEQGLQSREETPSVQGQPANLGHDNQSVASRLGNPRTGSRTKTLGTAGPTWQKQCK